MIKLKELGDLGDRMALGMPMTQGGIIGGGAIQLKGFDSPDIQQDPSKFGTLINNKNVVTQNNSKSLVTPLAKLSSKNSRKYNDDINAIKYKVTPDEVICGLNYELQHMVLKDSQIARQLVVKNLKADPHYYSKLHMLGVYPGEEDYPEADDSPIFGDIAPSLFEIVSYYNKNSKFKKRVHK